MRPLPVLPCLLVMLAVPMVGAAEGQGDGQGGQGRGGFGGDARRLEQLVAYAESPEGDAEAEERWAKAQARIKERRAELFTKLDANHDGTVSRAEAKAAIDALTAMAKERFPEAFTAADTDQDGRLSRAELEAVAEQRRQERERGKPDGDGGGAAKPPADRDDAVRGGNDGRPAFQQR